MILIRAIIEIVGGPPEHLAQALDGYVSSLKEKYKVLKTHIAEPQKQAALWSAWAELEMQLKSLGELLEFCIWTMPASIEILEPEELRLSAQQLTSFINDLQAKLHATDMLVKTLRAEKAILDKNAITILNNFIAALLRSGPKSEIELSAAIGIKPEELQRFLGQLKEKKKIVKAGELWELA